MRSLLFAVVALAGILALASADADNAYFIPKAFYKLEPDGHKSNVRPVSPHTVQYLRRLRRQVSSSSSSSSSVSSGSDGKVYFTSQQAVHNTPSYMGGISVGGRFGGSDSGYGNNGQYGNDGHYAGDGHYDGGYGHSSASSTVGGSNGGPVYFQHSQSVHGSSDPNVGLASRFGGSSTGSGKVVQTTGVVDEHGVVHYNTKTMHI